ncbi:MAG: HEAT repeat domain-containing protein [Planctomycetales bacterium]
MSTEKHLRYRGEITAIVGVGSTAAFVTRHPEGQPSALWRIDTEKLALASDPLPCGAVALLAIGTNLWISGDDGQLYKASAKGGKLKAVGPEFESPAVAMAPLSDKRVAVLASDAISVLSRKDGSLLQTLELPGKGSALASDPSGKWLVAGTTKGAVAVFECEEKDEFAASETETLHQGAVTSLLFEPEELRFLSAGADQKLLLTHARGQLEPEDRGRGAEHGSTVPIMLLATGLSGTGSQGTSERFYSGGRDESLKAWPVSGKGRPATMKDGVGKVIDMAIVEIHKRPHLVVAAKGNSLRIFPLDSSGKIGERSRKISDAYAWADDEFSQADPKRRETALQELAGYDDEESVKRISRLAGNDDDHALRVAATKLLAKSQHPQAPSLLEKRLSHKDEAIRRAAFAGLRKLLGDGDFRPIDLALKASKADVGVEAVRALESLAKKDDQALHRLENALDVKPIEVRRAALASLEIVHGKDSPDSNLLALKGKHDDVRRLGLIRLFQRKMLGHPRVLSAIRWRQEDREAEVRQTAVLVSLFTRDKLATAVRARDLDLHRRMWELESFDQGGAAKAKPKALPKQPKPPGKLSAEDYDPLLQAAASRALDTCLLGARCLALLGDSRAFGMLLQLSRENETQARVEVCRAFSALEDPRGVRRLRSLLHDEAAEVRDAAFSALARLHQDDPLSAAEAGLKATHEDVRGRALQALIQEIKRRPPQSESEPGWRLLQQALNDSF